METKQNSWWSRHRPLEKFIVLGIMTALFAAGYYVASMQHPKDPHGHEQVSPQGSSRAPAEQSRHAARNDDATLWTCAMHPQIKLPEPGQCPICGMDLVPVKTQPLEPQEGVVRHTMSEAAKRLAEVETAEVQRRKAFVKIRMVGMVFQDETRVASLTSRVDGRLDEVHVDFTGVKVNKGDPMVTIWSPTLIRSQVELFETIRSQEFGESVVRGAQEKLKQLGLTEEQIDEIRKSKKPTLYITLRAPISGIVMKKNVLLGDFVKEGSVMYEISDLSKVWIKLDAYETDLPWVRYGQKVTFTTPAIPGRTFEGTVVFIDPMLQMSTRSVKIRVEADNQDLALKPSMFVTAELEAEVDSEGRVIKSEWAGKYICPVDPEQVSSEPGVCEDTRIPLRSAKSYGYSPGKDPKLPLVIPATAVLYTGKRSIVYVEVPGKSTPTYELRQVVLGPRAGDEYVVFDGLRLGERVVTRGNFKIDSATQILARPSMMSPATIGHDDELLRQMEAELSQRRTDAPPAFGESLNPLLDEYLRLKDAIAKGDTKASVTSAKRLNTLIHSVDVHLLDPGAEKTWYRLAGKMVTGLIHIERSTDAESQRKAFRESSEALASILVGFWHVINKKLFVFNCATAFDNKGAYWIEGKEDFTNPYLPRDQRTCGKLVLKVPPEKVNPQTRTNGQAMGSASKHEPRPLQKSGTKHPPMSSGSDSKGRAKDQVRSSTNPTHSTQGSSSKSQETAAGSGSKHEGKGHKAGAQEHKPSLQGSDTKANQAAAGAGQHGKTRMTGHDSERHSPGNQGSGTKNNH
jgi:Cu(I)/Ag(I) efflux system membrane fusion protein